MDVNVIAANLEGFEETIISKLIDRAQFRANPVVYEPGHSGFRGQHKRSLFELRLRFQEEVDAQFGRYQVPEERPFSAGLPKSKRLVKLPPTGLCPSGAAAVDLTRDIMPSYLQLVNRICPEGADGHFGSSVEHDVYALQAIARRIHFGACYVAESKYRQDTAGYRALVHSRDTDGLLQKLTRKSVESAIIERVREKVAYLQGKVNTKVRHCIDPEIVLQYYRDVIIPLTKQGQVAYLVNRSHD